MGDDIYSKYVSQNTIAAFRFFVSQRLSARIRQSWLLREEFEREQLVIKATQAGRSYIESHMEVTLELA